MTKIVSQSLLSVPCVGNNEKVAARINALCYFDKGHMQKVNINFSCSYCISTVVTSHVVLINMTYC